MKNHANIVPIGGRIKAASIGLNLFEQSDVIQLDQDLLRAQKKPSLDHLKAFFPADRARMKQMLQGIGFFRPILKTDQGMPGNFLPFRIDLDLQKTDLSTRLVAREEGIAVPELFFSHNGNSVEIQEAFAQMDLRKVAELLDNYGEARRAEKGRLPFFFIRPALADRDIIFGQDIVGNVERAVVNALDRLRLKAREAEECCSGEHKEDKLLYCQPDVFVFSDGRVVVEKINCPDVGFFLTEIKNDFSQILPIIQDVVSELCRAVCDKVQGVFKKGKVTIITRDAVLSNNEDVLELKEISGFKKVLEEKGGQVSVCGLSQVNAIPQGEDVILFNLDYSDPGISDLLERHCNGSLNMYPNPFFQKTCQEECGLDEVIIPDHFFGSFLQLIGSKPKNEKGVRDVWQRLEKQLLNSGVTSNILQIDIGPETVPVFRNSLHSWRQLARRIRRYKAEDVKIKIRMIPASPSDLLLTSNTGPRLHAFRFMYC